MDFETGNGKLALPVMMGIWSVSALTSLPGLAVSPILGRLSEIFPNATELEIQMLTSLPSLLIIPFMLLSGKLTECIGYIRVLYFGLVLFLISGVLYFFSVNIWELILVSGILGIGAGMIIPLSAALISRFFTGTYRTKQFGYISAITNVTLVIATAVTGYLATIDWKLPFVVYLLPIVSLLLIPQISGQERKVGEKNNDFANEQSGCHEKSSLGIEVKPLLSNMWHYFLLTYLVLVVTFNLPFLAEEYGFHSNSSGFLISLFFLAIMLPGFFINIIRDVLGCFLRPIIFLMISLGLTLFLLFHSLFSMAVGCLIVGFGYGIAQPLIYDYTASIATPSRTPLALAWVMVMNYVAILATPFMMDVLQLLFHSKSQSLPFLFNAAISFVLFVVYLFIRKKNRTGTE